MKNFNLSDYYLVIFTVLILVLVWSLTACAYVTEDGRTFIGWGKAEFTDEDGNIRVIVSEPPVNFSRTEVVTGVN